MATRKWALRRLVDLLEDLVAHQRAEAIYLSLGAEVPEDLTHQIRRTTNQIHEIKENHL